MTEEQMFSGWANGHRSSAALEAVYRIYAHPEVHFRPQEAAGSGITRHPGEAHDRLSRMACALGHLSDGFAGMSFAHLVTRADTAYDRQCSQESPAQIAGRAAMAGRAIEVYDRQVTMPPAATRGQNRAAVVDLNRIARLQDLTIEALVTRTATRLLGDLHHYADRHGTGYRDAMTAGHQAYAAQRLDAEGRLQTGQDTSHSPPLLTPSPDAPAFELIATHQGIITTFPDAEWHLVRTAARVDYQARHLPQYPYDRDDDDLIALSRALGRMCGLTAEEIVRALTPRIDARITEIEQGPDAAADLGREHGRAGTPPYCDLDIDGDATALMHAFGETEPMTDANHPHRLALVTAYAHAYRQAAPQPSAAAASPARMAAEDFPRRPGQPAPPGNTPAAPDPPARQARTRPGTRLITRTCDGRAREDQQRQGDLMSKWTPESIRDLGVTCDVPTLGKIFGISRTRAYVMAQTGEWQQAGIRIVTLGTKYRVAVQSILDVLGHGDAGPRAGLHGNGHVPVPQAADDDAVTEPPGWLAAWNLR